MNNLLKIVVLWVILVTGFSSAKEQHKSPNGEITPSLSWVAFVEGKAFFVDFKTGRVRTQIKEQVLTLKKYLLDKSSIMNHNDIPQNQTEALAYCSTLGMQLAEIKSESQFMALHEADVGEWPENYGVWTAGMEITGIHRYIWSNSNAGINLNLPYQSITEEPRYGVRFRKGKDFSHLTNLWITVAQGTLCETLI